MYRGGLVSRRIDAGGVEGRSVGPGVSLGRMVTLAWKVVL